MPRGDRQEAIGRVELCHLLLGFWGLGWSKRHLVLPIWAELKKQPDNALWEAVLLAFFAGLAHTEPSLWHFSSQVLFDDIINHCFLLGDMLETCHKGLSPLAFLPRTHSDVHEENMSEDYYQEVTVKVVADVRKHRTKGPPSPIPLNDAKLLRLNACNVVVLKALFTEWSGLVQQETALHDGLQELQMDLFSRPESIREMIPQLLWAKIKAQFTFFLTTCTKEMLDVPPGSPPRIVRGTLTVHTMLFLSGTKVSLVGVPHQWLQDQDRPGPAKKQKGGGPTANGNGGSAPPPSPPAMMEGTAGQTHGRWMVPPATRTSRLPHRTTPRASTPLDCWCLHNPAKSMICSKSTPWYNLAW